MDTSLMALAVAQFERQLAQVGGGDWKAATPCSDWDVRALANHVLGELLWLPPLIEGRMIAEVGDQFDGDVLGDDPLARWQAAATAALAAAGEPDAGERTVHLSFGDFPGQAYVDQVIADVVIHTWDLARAIGGDDHLDDQTVVAAAEILAPQIQAWRDAGAFAAPRDAGSSADSQAQLLADTGRSPDWAPAG